VLICSFEFVNGLLISWNSMSRMLMIFYVVMSMVVLIGSVGLLCVVCRMGSERVSSVISVSSMLMIVNVL